MNVVFLYVIKRKFSLSPAETNCELATCKHVCTERTASLLCRVCNLHHLGPLEALDETFCGSQCIRLCTFSSVNSGPNKDGRIWRAWTRYASRPGVDMFCVVSVVECGGTKSRVIFWARIPVQAPSIYILIFSWSKLLFTHNHLPVVRVHSFIHHHHTFEVVVAVKSVLCPELHFCTRSANYLRISRRELGDGIRIPSSVVPSVETTDFALFIVSFSPTISGKKAVKYAGLLKTNCISGYCKCSSAYFWYFLAKMW